MSLDGQIREAIAAVLGWDTVLFFDDESYVGLVDDVVSTVQVVGLSGGVEVTHTHEGGLADWIRDIDHANS